MPMMPEVPATLRLDRMSTSISFSASGCSTLFAQEHIILVFLDHLHLSYHPLLASGHDTTSYVHVDARRLGMHTLRYTSIYTRP